MNAGRIATSQRLRDTLAAIDGAWRTTAEISQRTGSMAVHSDVAALRANGIEVWSERVTGCGRRVVYRYRAFNNKREAV